MIQLFIIFILLIGIGWCVPSRFRRILPYCSILSIIYSLFYFAGNIPVDSLPIVETVSWSRAFAIEAVFLLDGLSLLFALLITGIGVGVFFYASAYMREYPNLGSFYTTLTLFTLSMLGLVLSDNLIVLFVFWELTSVCSYLLIGYKHEIASTRESARRSFFITVGGGLFLLLAIVLISVSAQEQGLTLAESFQISKIPNLIETPSYIPILLCILIAVATKSAQFPFHIWLPSAMAGPTPVSSFLHSATMVKAGVFLLARLFPMLGGSLLWTELVSTMGALTLIVGASLTAAQTDVKKMLAYSTVSVLGILVMLLGIGTPMAIEAAVVFLVAHALYKAALFQIVGNIEYISGSRDIRELGGLASQIPLTALAAVLASLSMAGAPPLFGFFGKELSYMAKLEFGWLGLVLIGVAVMGNILLVGAALNICFRPFWGRVKSEVPLRNSQLPFRMAIPPFVFACLGLFVGILPHFFDKYLGGPTATAILSVPTQMKLKLWHGVNPEALTVMGLSVVVLGFGILVSRQMHGVIHVFEKLMHRFEKVGASFFYEKKIEGLNQFAARVTGIFQNGKLSHYLRIIFIGSAFILIFPLVDSLSQLEAFKWELSGLIAIVVIVPCLVSIVTKSAWTQLVSSAAIGLGIAFIFLYYGAPDLALTQILVDSLLVLFLILLTRPLPKAINLTKTYYFDWFLAGVLATLFVLIGQLALPDFVNTASDYFLENSYTKAFGQNVVNVILVDFRALDTFGEVVVVAAAMLGVGALLGKELKRAST